MLPGLWVSKTGLEAQQKRLAVITNNLANVNTVGFKRDRAVFADLLYQNFQQPGASSSTTTTLPTGQMIGTGVRIAATSKNHSTGNIVQTDRNLDLAISGRGLFQVTLPDGSNAYTYDGQFELDSSGNLVTSQGYQLQPAINIPTGTVSVTIANDGTVSVLAAGSSTPTQAGQIQLADFLNTAGLEPVGDNLYKETAASGSVTLNNPGSNGLGGLQQGAVNTSNVSIVEDMVGLIETQRATDVTSRALSVSDQTASVIIQETR